jgi:hypothetical protein
LRQPFGRGFNYRVPAFGMFAPGASFGLAFDHHNHKNANDENYRRSQHGNERIHA